MATDTAEAKEAGIEVAEVAEVAEVVGVATMQTGMVMETTACVDMEDIVGGKAAEIRGLMIGQNICPEIIQCVAQLA